MIPKRFGTLVFNVNWLGDVLFSTPFLRAVKKAFGSEPLVSIVPPRCEEVLKGNPNVDEIMLYDEEGRHHSPFGKLGFIQEIRSRNFARAFLLHRSFTRAWLVACAGIPERIGFDRRKRGWLLTRRVVPPPKPLHHRADFFLHLARSCGIEPDGVGLDFVISSDDEKKSRALLEGEGSTNGRGFAVLNPGGNWDLKRWPRDRFAALGDRLAERWGWEIVLTGSEKDRPLAQSIRERMRAKALVTCGRTSLKELGAIMKSARLVISNDSGPLHLALALGCKAIGLYGPTLPDVTGPLGRGDYKVLFGSVGCPVPCVKLDCPDNLCLQTITPGMVVAQAEALIAESV